jgi:hypothetical protein
VLCCAEPSCAAPAVQPASNLVFPSRRHENKAVMAVEVVATRQQAQRPGQQAQQGNRTYTFTFCLERIDKGPYKVGGMWWGTGQGWFEHEFRPFPVSSWPGWLFSSAQCHQGFSDDCCVNLSHGMQQTFLRFGFLILAAVSLYVCLQHAVETGCTYCARRLADFVSQHCLRAPSLVCPAAAAAAAHSLLRALGPPLAGMLDDCGRAGRGLRTLMSVPEGAPAEKEPIDPILSGSSGFCFPAPLFLASLVFLKQQPRRWVPIPTSVPVTDAWLFGCCFYPYLSIKPIQAPGLHSVALCAPRHLFANS